MGPAVEEWGGLTFVKFYWLKLFIEWRQNGDDCDERGKGNTKVLKKGNSRRIKLTVHFVKHFTIYRLRLNFLRNNGVVDCYMELCDETSENLRREAGIFLIRFGYTVCSKHLLQSLFTFFFKIFFHYDFTDFNTKYRKYTVNKKKS